MLKILEKIHVGSVTGSGSRARSKKILPDPQKKIRKIYGLCFEELDVLEAFL
jgi:hypothetical protein